MPSVENPADFRELSVSFIILHVKKQSLIINEQCFAKNQFSEIFKNIWFIEHLQVTASKEM